MKAIFSGSFDPLTNGHMDIIRRSSALFEQLIIAATESVNKKYLFTLDERLEHVRQLTSNLDNVFVMGFTGMLVDFAEQNGVHVIVRGLRTVGDFDFEYRMAVCNKVLKPGIETFFMTSDPEYLFLSSSAVKEIAFHGGDFEKFVPAELVPVIKERLNRHN